MQKIKAIARKRYKTRKKIIILIKKKNENKDNTDLNQASYLYFS